MASSIRGAGGSSFKVRENRLRRMADRQRYKLVKSRRRDPRAYDYGVYWIVDPNTNSVVTGNDDGLDLDAVEAWLTRDKDAS